MSYLDMGFSSPSPAPRHQDCGRYGCQLTEARQILAQARSIMEKVQILTTQATQALWCEQGEHAFSAKDPAVRVITVSGPDGEESHTICGKCTLTIGRQQAPQLPQDTVNG